MDGPGGHYAREINRRKTNTVCYHIYTTEYYSAIKKNEIMPSAATWMDPEIITLSEVRQRKTNIISDITYMWNLKYDTNELIYETETDSQT